MRCPKRIVVLVACCLAPAGCRSELSDGARASAGAALTGGEPVGLGLYFLNGAWNPDLALDPDPERPARLHTVDGPPRHLQELYLASAAPTTPAQGLAPVVTEGDLAGLNWNGLRAVGEDWRPEASGVTWQRQVFYRGAAWMEDASKVKVTVRDAAGNKLAQREVQAGQDDAWLGHDDFLERRFVARVLSTGCAAQGDCENAGAVHRAEALAQLAKALHPDEDAFDLPPAAATLTVTWTALPQRSWTVAVEHDAPGAAGYGLGVALEEVSPPPGGAYQPGDTVAVRMRIGDGDGVPLFAPGALPSYADVLHRRPAARGLRYVTFRQQQLYWAYKDLQAEMETFLAGPVHRMTRVASFPLTPFDLFAPEITLATREHDGWSGRAQATPTTPVLFACLLGLDPTACDAPAPDVFTFTVPADAESGTYVAGVKLRREWMGEPVQAAASIRVQVGDATPTTFSPFSVAPGLDDCGACHAGRASLPVAHHGFPGLNAVGPECLACHTDGYYFEPDAGLVVRLVTLHAASDRLTPPR